MSPLMFSATTGDAGREDLHSGAPGQVGGPGSSVGPSDGPGGNRLGKPQPAAAPNPPFSTHAQSPRMSGRKKKSRPARPADASQQDADELVDWVAARLVRMGRNKRRRRLLRGLIVSLLVGVLLVAGGGVLLWRRELLEAVRAWLQSHGVTW